MDGSVWLGPNAVLAFKREGYRWTDVNFKDMAESVFSKGFLKLASQYTVFGAMEMVRSAFIGLQLKELQKYISCIDMSDIKRYVIKSTCLCMIYAGILCSGCNSHCYLLEPVIPILILP